jgi:hypothetical protein
MVGDDKKPALIIRCGQTLPEFKNIGEVSKLSFYYLEAM